MLPDNIIMPFIYHTPKTNVKNTFIKLSSCSVTACYIVHLFLDAEIDDAQVLTLTREDLNELFPGIKNFQLRRTIMAIITDTVKVMSLVKMLVQLNLSGPPKIFAHSSYS